MPRMSDSERASSARSLPVVAVEQCVPSRVCLACEVCCRFPEEDSFLRPYFSREEMTRAVKHGLTASCFPSEKGGQIQVVPHPTDDGYLCPAFDPETFHCKIYEHRPLDCRIYPFTIMWNEDRTSVLLGWDKKCPFLVNEATGLDPVETLLPEYIRMASDLKTLLESDQVVHLLAQDSGVITRYQDDVVIVSVLPRLTAKLGETL